MREEERYLGILYSLALLHFLDGEYYIKGVLL